MSVWKKSGRFALLLLAGGLAVQSTSACETTGRAMYTGVAAIAMHTRRGESCDYIVADSKYYSSISMEYESVRIVAKPRSGVAGTFGRAGIAYKPKDGFVGVDSFVAEIRMKSATRGASTSTVNFSVQVD